MHSLAAQLRKEGRTTEADEVEKLAVQLEDAAKRKLEAAQAEAEKQVHQELGHAGEHAHALAKTLEDKNSPLAGKVEALAKQVDHLVGEEHASPEELREALSEAKDLVKRLRDAGLEEEAKRMEQVVSELEAALAADVVAEERAREISVCGAEAEAQKAKHEAADTAGHVVEMLSGDPAAQKLVQGALDQLEASDVSGEDLSKAAHEMHSLAAQLRKEGRTTEADEVEKLAVQLEDAAKRKLEAAQAEAEKQVHQELGHAGEHAHALAKTLEDKNSPLAGKVEALAKQVDHLVGEEHASPEELREALSEAKDLVKRLRDAGLEEEAKRMEQVVSELEAALAADVVAEERAREISVCGAEAEAEKAKHEAADTAGHVVEMLSGDPAAQKLVQGALDQLEASDVSGEDLSKAAHEMHSLAAQLRKEGRTTEADEVEKLAVQLEDAAKRKLEAAQAEAEKQVHQELGHAGEHAHALAKTLEDKNSPLAGKVEALAKQVDHLVGEEHASPEELREALSEAKGLVKHLRDAGLEEEAKRMEQVVSELEAALAADVVAEERARELAAANASVSSQEASSSDMRLAAEEMWELAQTLRAQGREHEAAYMDEMAKELEDAAVHKLQLELEEAQKHLQLETVQTPRLTTMMHRLATLHEVIPTDSQS